MNYPNYAGLSDATLKDLHDSIRKCLAADDKNPSAEKKFCVREQADWKVAKVAIEVAMKERKIPFEKISI